APVGAPAACEALAAAAGAAAPARRKQAAGHWQGFLGGGAGPARARHIRSHLEFDGASARGCDVAFWQGRHAGARPGARLPGRLLEVQDVYDMWPLQLCELRPAGPLRPVGHPVAPQRGPEAPQPGRDEADGDRSPVNDAHHRRCAGDDTRWARVRYAERVCRSGDGHRPDGQHLARAQPADGGARTGARPPGRRPQRPRRLPGMRQLGQGDQGHPRRDAAGRQARRPVPLHAQHPHPHHSHRGADLLHHRVYGLERGPRGQEAAVRAGQVVHAGQRRARGLHKLVQLTTSGGLGCAGRPVAM
ncbi:unnamed protein product, partial [Prorocentrum cordatum]